MGRRSAGILLFRETSGALEVLLVHPGGPFWAQKDDGAWSIPKGEFEENEDALTAARRELEEETGLRPGGDAIALEPLRQPGGKTVYAWAIRGDADPAAIKSNTFSMEWPPHSGHTQDFLEIDRAGWFTMKEAKRKVLKGQAGFLDQVQAKLAGARARKSPA